MTQLSRQQEELCEQSQWDFSDLRPLHQLQLEAFT